MSGDTEAHRLAALLVHVAEDLEGRGGGAYSGAIRRGARELVRLAEHGPDEGPDACPQCGGTVVQPARGRRRKWCTDACRRAAWRAGTKRGRNATVGVPATGRAR